MTNRFPLISIIIPTYNEERNIESCLDSILCQDYPELPEIIVVDNRSEDRTIGIVKTYIKNHKNIKLIFNDIEKHAETSKMMGLHYAKNDFFLYLDADIQLVGRNFFKKLIKPLLEVPNAVGSFPRFIPKKSHPSLARYLRYHPLELDSVFQFFCTEIKQTITESREEYKICQFIMPKIPPVGICIYRRAILFDCIGHMKRFMDIDIPVILSENGFNKFAYVPSCGIYHNSSFSLKEVLNKRKRNINIIYLPNIEKRRFKYFDLTNKKDVLRIFLWVICANLFIPKLITGIYKMFKHRDIACFYEPVLALILTDMICFEFLKSKIGRELIIKKIFHI